MNTILSFLQAHWELVALAGILLALILKEEVHQHPRGVTMVSPEEAIQLINKSKATVVDIRSKADFSQGHIINAANLAADTLTNSLAAAKKYAPIIVTCLRGQSCIPAATSLHQAGFDKVYTLQGGITAWKQAGLP